MSVSYCMVGESVREDNRRAFKASGLSPDQTQQKYNNLLIAPACIRTLQDIRC